MGKGMRAGKRPKQSGGKDMQKQMQQMQALQKKMDEKQAEIEEMEVTATSGGGAVEVTANGKKEIKNIKIDPQVIDPDDAEMLQDLVMAAANEAMRQMEELSQNEMEKLTGLRAKAGNDANVAALGEAWKGAAAGAKNVILVTLGTGVGGGIIVDGKIVGGAHGAGGEIGHAAVDHEEKEACNCGNCGCLEQYASATGIVRVAQRTLAATDEQTVLRKFTKLSAKNVLDAFKEGDKVACDVMAQVGEMLGGTLAMFACVTDPEAIVIGGGVSKAGQPLIDCIQKYYEKYAFTACKKTPIILATLGNDAGIYGSARMVIKEV